MTSKRFAGILLAGGKSSRFGKPKAFATYQQQPFYSFSLQALQAHTDEVTIISHPNLKNRFTSATDVSVREDDPSVQGKGPLAGIYTGMQTIASDWYIVLPCDTPLVNANAIKSLKQLAINNPTADAIIPIIDGKYQPLIAIYHHRCFQEISTLLTGEQSKVSRLFDAISTRFVSEKDLNLPKNLFTNVNTQEEWQRITR